MTTTDSLTDVLSRNIVETFFESRKNANCILDLEKDLLSDDVSCALQSMDVAQDLFTQIFDKDYLHTSNKAGNQEKFQLWLAGRYNDFVSHLLSYLLHEDENIQEKALQVLMKFLVLEGEKPLKTIGKGTWFFPKGLFEKIMIGLASHDVDQQALITKFHVYASNDDVKMYMLKCMTSIMDSAEVTDVFLVNCFCLLTAITYPKSFPTADEVTTETCTTLLSQENLNTPFRLKEKLFCKLFSNVWLRFLKYSLPEPLLKKTLVIAHKQIVPHLQNPCLMTDFLTDAYNHGGILSLLALNGLFILMQKYNVDYPDFYTKLYSLFDENIVNGKFSARFFYLSDLFLSSTHLPAYMVAAFTKKLSRIALRSKTECVFRIVPFILRSLIRHPTLNILIHRPDPTELSKDPFDIAATDPAKSNAIKSSLWEIKTLQHHINPAVSRRCKLIDHELQQLDYTLSDTLNLSADELYRKERKRKINDAPLAVKKPSKNLKWSSFCQDINS